MDLDISQLLSDLASTQAIQSAVRLSERNVVELVIKLKALGILGSDLLHTTNGREFITFSKLKTEVSGSLSTVRVFGRKGHSTACWSMIFLDCNLECRAHHRTEER